MLYKAETQKAETKIRRMEYRAAHLLAAARPSLRSGMPSSDNATAEAAGKTQAELLLATQVNVSKIQASKIQEMQQEFAARESAFAQQLDAAQQEAFERGRNEVEVERLAVLQRIEGALQASLGGFQASRDAYLEQVEQEVVRLALSIATRVLHREAQMDPLLLSGAVRVALGQLSDTTEVRLRVPAAEHEMWGEMIRLMPNLPLRPQIVANESLGVGECTLETDLGSVDLGVKAQLYEIERGFFDLLERREPVRRDEMQGVGSRE